MYVRLQVRHRRLAAFQGGGQNSSSGSNSNSNSSCTSSTSSTSDSFPRSPSASSSAPPQVALVSVTAGGMGLDLSVASVAVFVELPPDVAWLRQAEDRLHRRGQRNASVNVYYLTGPPVSGSSGAVLVG